MSEQPSTQNPEVEPEADAAQVLPLGVRVAAAWSWRLMVIGIALAAALWLIVQIRIIVIPLFIAILLAALLAPIVKAVMRIGLPKWVGVIVALAALFTSVGFLSYLVFTRFRSGFQGLRHATERALGDILAWLEDTAFLGFTFSIEKAQALISDFLQTISEDNAVLWSGALEIGATLGQVLAGALLTLFTLIFLLIDGKRIWMWALGFLPRRAHAAANDAGHAGWTSIGQYVRVQIFVAFVDAVGIGVGAAILNLPLVIPLSILVFLAAFIPYLGAITSGALAAFVALVYNGPMSALIMLGIVVLVNQIEGHILQPLVMGNAVRVHPLGVVVAVGTGAIVAGIPGALFAVPIVAALNSMVNTVVEGEWKGKPDPVEAFHREDRRQKTLKSRLRAFAKHKNRRSHEQDPQGGTA